MKPFKRKTYVDLEIEHIKEKYETSRMEMVEALVKQYPNDYDLGEAIRKFVNSKKSNI